MADRLTPEERAVVEAACAHHDYCGWGKGDPLPTTIATSSYALFAAVRAYRVSIALKPRLYLDCDDAGRWSIKGWHDKADAQSMLAALNTIVKP